MPEFLYYPVWIIVDLEEQIIELIPEGPPHPRNGAPGLLLQVFTTDAAARADLMQQGWDYNDHDLIRLETASDLYSTVQGLEGVSHVIIKYDGTDAPKYTTREFLDRLKGQFDGN